MRGKKGRERGHMKEGVSGKERKGKDGMGDRLRDRPR